MDYDRLKDYIKNNLKLDWQYTKDDKLYIVLELEGEIISKIRFNQD